MNKLFTKRIRGLAFMGTLIVVSFTLAAKPTLKTIKAYLNPTISYTLNGEKVLKDTQTITYNNKTYVPLAEVAKLMALQVKLENNTVVMTTKSSEQGSLEREEFIIPRAIIKQIDSTHRKVTILRVGNEDKIENYIVLNISNQTKIKYEDNDKVYNIEDLKRDMEVGVKHSKTITFSNPPQTEAFEIKILSQKDKEDQEEENKEESEKEKTEKQTILKDIKIVEVNNSEKYIIVEAAEKQGTQFKLSFDHKTKVKYEEAKKQPHANALKAGQVADIKIEGSMTSLNTAAKILEITVKSK